jgi:hypothetical protein
LVDKALVRITSNIHSKSCLKGPTFTVEPDRGAISGTVPGNRTEDRKVVGHGPGGGSTITSNRDCRYASRRTAGSFGRFVVRSTPCALHAPSTDKGQDGRPYGLEWTPVAAACASSEGTAHRERPDALLRSSDVELQRQCLAGG